MRNRPGEYSAAAIAADAVVAGVGSTANAQAPADPGDPFAGGLEVQGIDLGGDYGDAPSAPPARVQPQVSTPALEASVVAPEDAIAERLNRAHEIYLLNDKGEQVDVTSIPALQIHAKGWQFVLVCKPELPADFCRLRVKETGKEFAPKIYVDNPRTFFVPLDEVHGETLVFGNDEVHLEFAMRPIELGTLNDIPGRDPDRPADPDSDVKLGGPDEPVAPATASVASGVSGDTDDRNKVVFVEGGATFDIGNSPATGVGANVRGGYNLDSNFAVGASVSTMAIDRPLGNSAVAAPLPGAPDVRGRVVSVIPEFTYTGSHDISSAVRGEIDVSLGAGASMWSSSARKNVAFERADHRQRLDAPGYGLTEVTSLTGQLGTRARAVFADVVSLHAGLRGAANVTGVPMEAGAASTSDKVRFLQADVGAGLEF